MECKGTEMNKSIYTIERVFCGTKTANEAYKYAIFKVLDEDCNGG